MTHLSSEQFQDFLEKYLRQDMTAEELELFFEAARSPAFEQQLQDAVLQDIKAERFHGLSTSDQAKKLYQQWIEQGVNQEQVTTPARIKWMKPLRYAAAIILLVGFSMGLYYLLNHPITREIGRAITVQGVKKDIPPGHSGAILTLSNGQKIVLDSAGNGVFTSDANVRVIKKDGEITYQGQTSEIVYNDVTTDRGRQWRLTLSDGTKVWLNAVSSIHYPLTFTGNERVVEITGEAYFEVAKNEHQHFKVKVGDQIIEDIGTHFNINAYSDESSVRTTLIEGSVKVINGSSSVIIKPGEEASLVSGSNKILVSPADVEAAIAWKNGVFELTNANVASIMRQVSRWYDVEITYKGDVPKGTISGEVPRNLNLSEVLKVLALSGIRCELDGRKLTVFD